MTSTKYKIKGQAEVTIIIPIEHIGESLVPEATNECHLNQLYPLHLIFYDCYVKTCGGRAGIRNNHCYISLSLLNKGQGNKTGVFIPPEPFLCQNTMFKIIDFNKI